MAQVSERGGDLVGALTVAEDDEVMVVMEKGKIVRSGRRGAPDRPEHPGCALGRPTPGDAIVAMARNAERAVEAELAGTSQTMARIRRVRGRMPYRLVRRTSRRTRRRPAVSSTGQGGTPGTRRGWIGRLVP